MAAKKQFPLHFDNNYLDNLPVAWPAETWTFSFPVILSSSSPHTLNPVCDNVGPATKISVLSIPCETSTSCLSASSLPRHSLFIYSRLCQALPFSPGLPQFSHHFFSVHSFLLSPIYVLSSLLVHLPPSPRALITVVHTLSTARFFSHLTKPCPCPT